MNNYNSYKEAESSILEGAYETMRSDISEGMTGQENYSEECFIISIPHTFYVVLLHDTQEALIDHVRQGHSA